MSFCSYLQIHFFPLVREQDSTNQMEKLVMETFPNAYIDEHFEERIVFKIPQQDVTTLAGCFSMLEEGRKVLFVTLHLLLCVS